jgi:invasion protein IalB
MNKTAVSLALALGFSLAAGAVIAQEAPPAAAPAVASTLPGGASSASETHGDWTVSCQMGQADKQCVLSQALADTQSGQRVLALELTVPSADTAEGMLLAPFGLKLNDGVKLSVDGKALGDSRAFLTCIPSGCLVPVTFDAASLAALRAGTNLEVTGVSADSTQQVALALSLSGFTAAVARTGELTK